MTTAYPLAWPEGWPRATSRKRAKFGKNERQYSSYGSGSYDRKRDLTINDATQRVLAELSTFGVPHGEWIVSTNLELRLDGLPRSGQSQPADPGAAVYWRKRNGPMKVMAIDIYDRVADNLAAIAATLSAMRAIERHGGAQILDRAFTGFTALPPPLAWHQILGLQPGAKRSDVEAAHRRLAMEHHPDRGGSPARMSEINAARDAALKELPA